MPWLVDGVLLEPQDGFDAIAVKDPSIAFANGQWHLFYTAIGRGDEAGGARRTIGYVAATQLDQVAHATRLDLKRTWPGYPHEVMAPQVFYARNLSKWVLIAQRPTPGPTRYLPVFSLSDDAGHAAAWSQPQDLVTANQLPWGRTAIDFWVIADDNAYWLFFSDQRRGIWAMETSIDSFPEGFSEPRRVLIDRGDNWELHEAAHIYYVLENDDYRLFVEAFEYGGTHANHLDRYIAIYRADALPGPWRRCEQSGVADAMKREYVADASGRVPGVHQLSHPEWIRLNVSNRLMMDENAPVIIQETTTQSPSQEYLSLGWRLTLITPALAHELQGAQRGHDVVNE